MKILLVSFIYLEVEKYLEDFIKSIKQQTYLNFDVLIYNDGANTTQLQSLKCKILNNVEKYGIVELRRAAIVYAIEKDYDLLVFADSDDLMGIDRMNEIVNAYDSKISFFYNNLFLLGKNKDFYAGKLPDKICNVDKLKNSNFLGMSHTAINIKKEKKILSEMPLFKDLIAFDWFLYSYILINGGVGIKVDTKTFYRIHENNIAGEVDNITFLKLDTGIKVKKMHYKAMCKLDVSYIELLNQIEKLEERIKNKEFLEKYIYLINKEASENKFWWGNIKFISEIEGGKYDN